MPPTRRVSRPSMMKFLGMIRRRKLPITKNAAAVPREDIRNKLSLPLQKTKGMSGIKAKIPNERNVARPSPNGLLTPFSKP